METLIILGAPSRVSTPRGMESIRYTRYEFSFFFLPLVIYDKIYVIILFFLTWKVGKERKVTKRLDDVTLVVLVAVKDQLIKYRKENLISTVEC